MPWASLTYTAILLSVRMPRHHRKLIVLFIVSLSFASCSKDPNASAVAAQGTGGSVDPGAARGTSGGSGRAGRGGGGGPVPVTTALVRNTAVPVTIPSVGTAEALQTVQVRAQVTGQLSSVHFSEGQEVKRG